MGIWSSFRAALGLDPAPKVRDLAPLALTRPGLDQLDRLPPHHGLVLRRHATGAGHVVSVDEGPVEGPFPQEWDELPIDAPPDLRHALRGLVLHHEDGRWRLEITLKLRARETPNPHSRMYEADRLLCPARRFFSASTSLDKSVTLPDLARLLLRRDDIQTLMVRGHTISVERTEGHPWPPIDRAVGEALRAHLLGGGGLVPAEPADPEARDELWGRVLQVIEDDIRPALHADGGDLELIDVREGVVTVHLVGACRTCPASALTLHAAVERTLRRALPGEVDQVVPYDA